MKKKTKRVAELFWKGALALCCWNCSEERRNFWHLLGDDIRTHSCVLDPDHNETKQDTGAVIDQWRQIQLCLTKCWTWLICWPLLRNKWQFSGRFGDGRTIICHKCYRLQRDVPAGHYSGFMRLINSVKCSRGTRPSWMDLNSRKHKVGHSFKSASSSSKNSFTAPVLPEFRAQQRIWSENSSQMCVLALWYWSSWPKLLLNMFQGLSLASNDWHNSSAAIENPDWPFYWWPNPMGSIYYPVAYCYFNIFLFLVAIWLGFITWLLSIAAIMKFVSASVSVAYFLKWTIKAASGHLSSAFLGAGQELWSLVPVFWWKKVISEIYHVVHISWSQNHENLVSLLCA